MTELKDFYHDGYAWVCRQCEREMKPEKKKPSAAAKIFTEGEAESKLPNFATKAMAKWADPARRFLTCPRCGTTEDTEVH
jgi:hypothetical protein